MTELYGASHEVLRLWKLGYITATGHTGATVEVIDALHKLQTALDQENDYLRTIEEYRPR